MASSNPTYGTVHNEGCDLHYWSLGSGPLLIFVPGGGGHGSQYNPIMTALSDKYTCATLDRRQMSASKTSKPKMFSYPQQARDVRAVIQALGFDKAIVFGNSSGGIIALQFGLDHPHLSEHIIAHEAPTVSLLPDASEKWELLLSAHEVYKAEGQAAAMRIFGSAFKGMDDPNLRTPVVGSPKGNGENFWAHEFLIASTYVPNLHRMRESGVSVAVLAGERSGDAFYARTPYAQQKILGCHLAVVPGHHGGYEAEVDAFVPPFLECLKVLDQRKAMGV